MTLLNSSIGAPPTRCVGEFGMLRLQILKAAHHLIKIVVADLGRLEVVQPIVALELRAQLVNFGFRAHFCDVIVPSRRGIATLVLAMLLAVPPCAAGASLHTGDLITALAYLTTFTPPPPRLAFFDATLAGPTSFADRTSNSVAIGGNGTIYALTERGIERFDSALNIVTTIPAFASSIDADRSGNVYGLMIGGGVNVWDIGGNLIRQIQLPDARTGFMDLAPDDCTLWYSDSASHAQRYDICRSRALPPLPGPQQFFFVRGLADGGLIGGFGSDLFVYDANGELLRILHIAAKDSTVVLDVGFSPDSRFMYLGLPAPNGSIALSKMQVADGTVVKDNLIGNLLPLSIGVIGGEPPTAKDFALAAVPTVSGWMFAVLAAAFALIALRRIA